MRRIYEQQHRDAIEREHAGGPSDNGTAGGGGITIGDACGVHNRIGDTRSSGRERRADWDCRHDLGVRAGDPGDAALRG